jgi:2-dehydropantoate 2-reductase
MDILLIGSGVIGSVYGAQLALAGQHVWVYAHSDRDREVARNGIKILDAISKAMETATVTLAENSSKRVYDIVLVAVRSDQLKSTFSTLAKLTGSPHIIFLGNNPDGYKTIPKDLPGTIELGFPGIGGSMHEKFVEYVHIPQQPTTLETDSLEVSLRFASILKSRGFPVKRTNNIDGWLAYHSVFVGSIAGALLRSGVDASRLGNNHELLRLMCQSIEEGFTVLKVKGTQGLPRNLAILHQPLLRPFAIHYWGKAMRSPMGELYFAAHTRHATVEMKVLAQWVLWQAANSKTPHEHLERLLAQ